MKFILLISSTIIISFSISFSAIIFVPTDQPTIQAGIDMAMIGDTVMVLSGTYTGTGNRNINFNGKAITVISEKGPDSTIIDLSNSRGFIFDNGEVSTSLLQGFTIANGSGDNGGGAILCVGSSPTINDMIFINNTSYGAGPMIGAGGGIFFINSNSSVTNCRFENNGAGDPYGSGPSGGGGISCLNSDLLIKECLFNNNRAAILGYGNALVSQDSKLLILNCTFVNNRGQNPDDATITNFSSKIILEKSIIAFSSNFAIRCFNDFSSTTISCTDIFGNIGGDWVNCISGMENINNNFSSDPLFCDTSLSDFSLDGFSPCAQRNNSCNVLIGAVDVGCNCCLIGGDIDYSGEINIVDLTRFVKYIFVDDTPLICIAEADVDGNKEINISDLVYFVSYIFRNGNEPVACL